EEERRLRTEGGVAYPGMVSGLATLRERYPLFIVSNCQRGYIETFLDTLQLRLVFQDFECHGNTGRTKGENLVDVLRRNRLDSALMVGDTTGDQEAARQGGIPFLHAAYGFGAVADPDARCEDFAQVVETCLAWGR
ncbi:MAG TPA: HAD-IA family hydrolase, partial [bacterium]